MVSAKTDFQKGLKVSAHNRALLNAMTHGHIVELAVAAHEDDMREAVRILETQNTGNPLKHHLRDTQEGQTLWRATKFYIKALCKCGVRSVWA